MTLTNSTGISTSASCISAIVVAGGSGLRFGGPRPKQLALLAGRPLLARTVAAFEDCPCISEIILVLPEPWLAVAMDEAIRPFGFTKAKSVTGGDTRTESTRRGLAAAAGDLILVHDGVRPLVKPALIEAVARAAAESGAALAAVPVRDTLKEVVGGQAVRTVDRARLWRAQTPQGFRRDLLARALAEAGEATDELGLLERLGLTATVVPGSADNLKITTPEDLALAETLLNPGRPTTRVGHGYDLHRLVPGRPLWLGCRLIPFDLGLLGHSDADVLAHALADALLGAAGLGDIGQHFPDNDPRWAGAAGADLLGLTMAKVRAAGYELAQADLTLVGERPRLATYREAMAEALAGALGVTRQDINLKATTTEGLDATGRGLALAAYATATLYAK